MFGVLVAVVLSGCIPIGRTPPKNPEKYLQAPPPSPMTAVAQMVQQRAMLAATAPVKPKTNGIITLAWDFGVPLETYIRNNTMGRDYFVGAVTNVTLGQQLEATNSHVAYNTLNGMTGFSNTILTPVASSQTRLSFAPYIFKADWMGAAGMVQVSSNLIVWINYKPISSGGSILLTNNGKQQFFRVKL
jgi:hypothetical protein